MQHAIKDARNYLARERGLPETPEKRAPSHPRYRPCVFCERVIFPSDTEVRYMHERCAEIDRERWQ